MRLSEFELRAIKVLARRHFGANAVVRLFGSRTDDTLVGGDVDLHIEAESEELASLQNELAFRVDLTDVIEDQKVDVIVRAPSYEPRAIDRIAQHTGLRLA